MATTLKVINHGKDLSKWLQKDEKDFVFNQEKGKDLTYEDLKKPELSYTLNIINQYITVGKAERFIQPHRVVAVYLHLAMQHRRQMLIEFATCNR